MQIKLHRLKLRWRRVFRSRRKQATKFEEAAGWQLEHNLLFRFKHLRGVWRFTVVWLVVCLLLIGSVAGQIEALGGYYKTLQPVPGGRFSEGVVGRFTNANPLYATGAANSTVSQLIFAGLFKYDHYNQLVGDLASGYDVSDKGTIYTVHLRHNLRWQDGKPLTAKDVVFTYHTIQNPDTQSPLLGGWKDVAVTAQDPHTVVFRLPNPLTSFAYSLTNGIVPKHLLQHIAPSKLRGAPFNTVKPVGAGPFALQAVQVKGDSESNRQTEISLKPFENYHSGTPKLNNFVIHSFATKQAMTASFRDNSIDAMAGLHRVPKSLADDRDIHTYNLPLTAATMVFFKNSSGVLRDRHVRRALVGAAQPADIRAALGYHVLPVDEPLLKGQLGYAKKYHQLHFDKIAKASAILKKDGWKYRKGDSSHIRYKKGQPLTFGLYAQNTPQYTAAARKLQRQWRKIGVNMQVYLQNSDDLLSTISSRSYGALLYSISIGVDPDVFAYWDSSQADVRSATELNFSDYKSKKADLALEAGRTRLKPKLRAVKYHKFLKAWQKDAPALGLYQPRLLYITNEPIYHFSGHPINVATNRFSDVQDWMVLAKPQPNHYRYGT
jgi:peptide/nickel transport system substrate-binding protein